MTEENPKDDKEDIDKGIMEKISKEAKKDAESKDRKGSYDKEEGSYNKKDDGGSYTKNDNYPKTI